MGGEPRDALLAGVVRAFDDEAELLRSWRLAGGVSAQVTGLEVALADGRRQKFVIRQYGTQDHADSRHLAVADEASLHGALRAAGLPVPRPHHADGSGRILPHPYLVMDFAEGEPLRAQAAGLPGAMRQMADVLARIHGVAHRDLPFLRDQQETVGARLREHKTRFDRELSEGAIRAALTGAWPVPRRNEPVLLHGDFWPGNTLWRHGALVAVLDWEDAAFGDPLADLANGRLEIAMAFGPAAAAEFTSAYRTSMSSLDYGHLPWWDLCAALRPAGRMSRWGLDAGTLRLMRARHREFTVQALAALPA